MRALRLLARRFAADERGLALIEFAFVGPILILLYLAGFQVLDALACNRKVTIATRAVADLTSQYPTLTSAQAASILAASTQIMTPYDASKAGLRVTELYTDTNGNTTVQWSKATANWTARVAAASYALPSAIATKGNYLILAETSYGYVPPVSFRIINRINLGETIYMSPRVSTQVTYSG